MVPGDYSWFSELRTQHWILAHQGQPLMFRCSQLPLGPGMSVSLHTNPWRRVEEVLQFWYVVSGISSFRCIFPSDKNNHQHTTCRSHLFEGSLEAKLPTIWTGRSGRHGESQKGEDKRWRRSEREKVRREDAGVRRGRKVVKHCVFPVISGSGGSKSRLAKAAGAEPHGQMRDEKLHAVVAWTTFWSEKCKSTSVFELSEKVHAVVARSWCGSQNVRSTPCWDHVWKLSFRKSARRCGAKHVWKWTCLNTPRVGTTLDFQMSSWCRKSARCGWREAHFQVKSVKNCGF